MCVCVFTYITVCAVMNMCVPTLGSTGQSHSAVPGLVCSDHLHHSHSRRAAGERLPVRHIDHSTKSLLLAFISEGNIKFNWQLKKKPRTLVVPVVEIFGKYSFRYNTHFGSTKT